MCNILDRYDLYAVLAMHHAECLMQTKFANPVILIKLGKSRLHLLRGMILCKLLSQGADPFTDTAVIHLGLGITRYIVRNQRKIPNLQSPSHFRKIIIKKFFKNYNIMQYRLVNGSLDFTTDLTGLAVAVLIVYQKVT